MLESAVSITACHALWIGATKTVVQKRKFPKFSVGLDCGLQTMDIKNGFLVTCKETRKITGNSNFSVEVVNFYALCTFHSA